jgi:PAS domain S-box-containing protein
VGKPLTDLPAWSSDPAVQEHLRAAIARASRGETVRFEARIHPRKDLSLDILMTITSHRDASQQVEYLICAGRDITERKHAEDELRTLVDAIPQFVWIMRPNGAAAYANQRWRDYTGKTSEQIQGDGWLQFIHPDDRPRVQEAWQIAVRTGTLYEVEHRIQEGSTGGYRWFLARSIPYQDTQGTILYWVGTCTDIDEQKRAEQRQKGSEENWRVLAETVPQLVWTTQPDGSVTYWNQRWYDAIGASPKQSLGHAWSQFLHPDDHQHTLAVWHHALETGEPYEIHYRLKHGQTGVYRWFLARGMPVRDETGQITKWFGTCTDIEEQKQTEQQLQESRENWRVLAETVPHLVWSVRSDGRLEYANQRACDYLGAFPEYMVGDEWRPFVHPEDFAHVQAVRRHALETGEPYEMEYRLKESQTDRYRWFLGRALPVRDDTSQVVKWLGTSTDIEDQKRVEQALRDSQERIRALIDSNIIGITSNEGEEEVLVEANEAFLHMTGYTQEDVRSRTLNRVKITPPEQAPLFQRALQEVAKRGQHTPIETEIVCKDGSRLPVLAGGVAFQDHPRQIIGFVLDNSARNELEQRKDDFISMASHELRNPLAAVKMQTQLVQKRLERQAHHEAATALSRVEGPVKQLERLIGELLDVSKIQAGRLEYLREPVDLEALLREITDTMQQSNPSHTLVVCGTVGISLIGDRDRLGQVFINLLSNAIKYSPDAETIEMDLSASPETVTVSVRDHGLGIPREQRDKIFERFYRASGPKQRAIPGLGMGLYIVAEIVKRHGGTITVDSAVGEGSTFTVTLPKKRDG